jgi:hypothetical protein
MNFRTTRKMKNCKHSVVDVLCTFHGILMRSRQLQSHAKNEGGSANLRIVIFSTFNTKKMHMLERRSLCAWIFDSN